MSKFDIRSAKPDDIDTIVFADTHSGYSICVQLEKVEGEGVVQITDEENDYVYIGCEEDALNLIKAITKAIDLGWFRE